MKKPILNKKFEQNINKLVIKALLSKWYWFIFIVCIKISTVYLVRNIIPRFEIPINVFAKESPSLLYSTVAFIVIYKTIEQVLNNISDLTLRKNINFVSIRLKEFLFYQINKTKLHFLEEKGASLVESFNFCASSYTKMMYTISYIIPDIIMVIFIFSIMFTSSKSLVALSILWAIISIVTYLITTSDLKSLLTQSQQSMGKVSSIITSKVRNRQLEFFYCQDERSLDLFEKYEKESVACQERINQRYQMLSFLFNIILFGIQMLCFNLYLSHLLNLGKISVSHFQDIFYANNAFCTGIVGNLLRNIPEAIKQYKESNLFPDLLAPNLRPPIKNLSISENPSIVVDGIEFSYNKVKIFNHFSFKIPYGSKVAIVGVPGVGKTTLFNLICGIVEPLKGKIKVGESDILQVSRESVVNTFAYIFEDPKLLPGTLKDNLTMGNDISEIEIKNALVEIGLEKWISSLHGELQEISVSNDEKKNIMFLRTYLFIKKTSIILADDPLEHLVGENKIKVLEMLKKVSKNKTLLVVGNDFVSMCDHIIFIDRRKVYFSTHQELLKKSSYQALFEDALQD